MTGASKRKIVWIVLVAVIIGLAGAWYALFGRAKSGTYAVFLSSGQVYFGTIAKENSKILLLKNIYYIQPKDNAAQPTNANDITIAKFGKEFHAPEDWMEITRAQIIMIEKLREDGQVVKAIVNFKK